MRECGILPVRSGKSGSSRACALRGTSGRISIFVVQQVQQYEYECLGTTGTAVVSYYNSSKGGVMTHDYVMFVRAQYSYTRYTST